MDRDPVGHRAGGRRGDGGGRRPEQVAPSAETRRACSPKPSVHLYSAELVADADPAGGYDLLYAAARKAMAAALAVQGLRVTARAGTSQSKRVTAQLSRSGAVVRPLGRLRRTRNDADYP